MRCFLRRGVAEAAGARRLPCVRVGRMRSRGTAGAVPDKVEAATTLADVVRQRKYRGWLVDQFGVLHDGVVAYPRAVALVRELAEQGCKVVILTNSARRAPHTLERLTKKMGFDPAWIAGVATSGDVTHRVLSLEAGEIDESLLPRDHALWRDLNPGRAGRRRCLHLTWSEFDHNNGIDLARMGIDVVDTPDDADFVCVHWLDAIATQSPSPHDAPHGQRLTSPEEVEAIARRAAELGLPVLCANPDIVAGRGTRLLPMPGSFCLRYKELGGPPDKIHLLGKPNAIIYNMIRDSLLPGLPQEAVIAVGDSLEHDILGACDAGIDSVFITRGIHQDLLHVQQEEACEAEGLWDTDALSSLCDEYCCEPTFTSAFFEV